MMVNFLHPRTSSAFEADVEPTTTGERCVAGLIDAGFIEPAPKEQPYSLVLARTRQQVLPHMTMQAAHVVEGDSLSVLQMQQGA